MFAYKIERVQKCALLIILGDKYESYKNALLTTHLETLEKRREILTLKFAKKAIKHKKFKEWFVKNNDKDITRSKRVNFLTVRGNKKC